MIKMKRWHFIAGVSLILLVAAVILRALDIISQAVYFWPGFLSVVILVAIIAYFLPFAEDKEEK